MCIWWVGDLPDYDDLFDRMVVDADVVIVNSQEMDLRDLEKLSSIAQRSRGRYALADLAWIRLRSMQDLVARFFDDEQGRACLPTLERIDIEFSPREGEQDAASTRSGLLFGWMAHALGLPHGRAAVEAGEGWAEVQLGRVAHALRAEAEARGAAGRDRAPDDASAPARASKSSGRTTRRSSAGRATFRACRRRAHLLRVHSLDETTLLVRCLERPKRDRAARGEPGRREAASCVRSRHVCRSCLRSTDAQRSPSRKRRVRSYRRNAAIAMPTSRGPSRKPTKPNSLMPPKRATNVIQVDIVSPLPTSFGRTR